MVPSEFGPRLAVLARNLSSLSLLETGLGAGALLVIVLCTVFVKRVPGYIVALFLGTAAVVVLKLPVETIGSRFGGRIDCARPHQSDHRHGNAKRK